MKDHTIVKRVGAEAHRLVLYNREEGGGRSSQTRSLDAGSATAAKLSVKSQIYP